jgi:D-beta-D-heptose 7-phosphate kinase/D-beta-D-heptose 1-phosphate adenosyltransferase
MKTNKTIVAVSGGFDPIHIGHVRLINEAKALGDYLVVILNNDNWLRSKKGHEFMPQEERKEILESLASVDEVVITEHSPDDSDRSVCESLKMIQPNIFANGGDRKGDNIPEYKLCEELGIQMHFNIGEGGKIQSSSELVAKASKKLIK